MAGWLCRLRYTNKALMRAALAQERKLGDEERADLEKQAVELGKQLEAGPAEPETLQRAAMVYATLGRPQDAAGVLEKLVEKEPGRAGTWEMLVRACCILGPPVMALPRIQFVIQELLR